jgi:quinoprotein dehydrogenase-associated probable ABC transporter substrate-binding protein
LEADVSARAIALSFALLAVTGIPVAAQQKPAVVSEESLRVCADPANLPFSDRDGRGFENKIAELIAADLKVPLSYFWMPEGPGFVRNTLGTKLCDVIMGYAQGAGLVENTNPYYKSTFSLVVKADSPLAQVDSLADPRLKDARLGIVAGTPAADYFIRYGLMAKAKPFPLVVDHRYETPSENMVKDIASGDIDGGILWGPIGGYYASKASVPMKVIPLTHETNGPPMSFRITFGTRLGEAEWKHRLNDLIKTRQADIDKILLAYGVPLVDEDGKPITTPR